MDSGVPAVQVRKGYRVGDTGVSAVTARPEARLRLLQLRRALSRAVCLVSDIKALLAVILRVHCSRPRLGRGQSGEQDSD